MKLTSFGFVELAETFLKDALSSPPLGGGSWGFQRSVNFSERTGSLQVLIKSSSGVAKTKVSIQARQTGSAKDYSIQGWSEIADKDERTNFVLKESNPYRLEEEIFEIVDKLLAEIPERDQSVTVDRPAAPAPKSTFTPLVPEIQKVEPEQTAESFDSNQAFIDSLLSGNNQKPVESEAPAESFDSNQALVDSLLSGNKEKSAESESPTESFDSNQALVDSLLGKENSGSAPVAEETASEPEAEAPAEETASEEPAAKPKAAKAKKSAKS